MANNAVKVTDLAIATNAAPSDRLMILRQPVGAPSVRTIAISDLTGYLIPANNTVAGVVIPDGNTIIVNANGVISSVTGNINPNTHYVYSANYLATANDNFIVVNNNGADRTIYLPNSGITEGKTYTIKKSISFTSSNTIVSANGLLIDGSANVNINSGYGYVTLIYSNSTGTPVWWITSKLL
jgi:hypothetical protein